MVVHVATRNQNAKCRKSPDILYSKRLLQKVFSSAFFWFKTTMPNDPTSISISLAAVQFLGCSEAKYKHQYGCDRDKQSVKVRDRNNALIDVSTFSYRHNKAACSFWTICRAYAQNYTTSLVQQKPWFTTREIPFCCTSSFTKKNIRSILTMN